MSKQSHAAGEQRRQWQRAAYRALGSEPNVPSSAMTTRRPLGAADHLAPKSRLGLDMCGRSAFTERVGVREGSEVVAPII